MIVTGGNDENDYRCGEGDVVCGAGDAASRGGGAITKWQLLEVQPDQDDDGGDCEDDDGDGCGDGDCDGDAYGDDDDGDGELHVPDLTHPLVHSFDQVDTSACSVVLARIAGILKKKYFLKN